MYKKFLSAIIIGALNVGLVPVAFAEDDVVDNTDVSVEDTGPCADLDGFKKFRCIRRNHRQAIKEECGEIEDKESRRECIREQRKTRMQQFKESHPQWKRGVRRRIGHSLKEKCGEMKGKEKRDCIRSAKKGLLSKHPRRMRKAKRMFGPETREALKECREIADHEDRRQCVNDLRGQFLDQEGEE